jgi:sugar lactone lactonase YvrE
MYDNVLHDRVTKAAAARYVPSLASLLIAALPGTACAASPGAVFQGQQATVAIGLGIPHATAVDAAGNIYVTDLIDSRVFRIQRASSGLNCTVAGSCTSIGSGFVQPAAIAVDAQGSVYVADASTQSLYKITTAGTQTTLASNLSGASGIALASDGGIYVAVTGSVKRVSAAGAVTTFATGPAQPGGIWLAAGGKIYVADVSGNRVVAIAPGGVQSTVATGLNAPQSVALDNAGNLYITDTGNNRVVSVPATAVGYVCPADCAISAANVKTPGGVSSDANGSLYIADTGDQQLVKLAMDADFGTSTVNAPGGTAPTAITLNYLLNSSSCASPPTVKVLTRGTSAKDFTYNSAENVCTHGASDLLSITVRFAPLSPGLRRGSVQLTDSTGISQVATYLHGIGTGPEITWTPGVVTTAVSNSGH